ncbi:hypothetical protein [Streptomyces sp. NBC_00391]|uniref:hypothetical protein n=1 Tax=Streptomyces sp. NBC_00391 TaxID=2903647 RepID=UPI002E1CD7EE
MTSRLRKSRARSATSHIAVRLAHTAFGGLAAMAWLLLPTTTQTSAERPATAPSADERSVLRAVEPTISGHPAAPASDRRPPVPPAASGRPVAPGDGERPVTPGDGERFVAPGGASPPKGPSGTGQSTVPAIGEQPTPPGSDERLLAPGGGSGPLSPADAVSPAPAAAGARSVTPTDGGAAPTDDEASGVDLILPVAAAGAAVAVATYSLVRRRRRAQLRTTPTGVFEPLTTPLPDLHRRAQRLLVETDDSVRTSAEELRFAAARPGQGAAEPLPDGPTDHDEAEPDPETPANPKTPESPESPASHDEAEPSAARPADHGDPVPSAAGSAGTDTTEPHAEEQASTDDTEPHAEGAAGRDDAGASVASPTGHDAPEPHAERSAGTNTTQPHAKGQPCTDDTEPHAEEQASTDDTEPHAEEQPGTDDAGTSVASPTGHDAPQPHAERSAGTDTTEPHAEEQPGTDAPEPHEKESAGAGPVLWRPEGRVVLDLAKPFAETPAALDAVQPFVEALADARGELVAAFVAGQRLDEESDALAPDEERALLEEILTRCTTAQRRLDTATPAFDQLRSLERDITPALECAEARFRELTGRTATAATTLTALRDGYASAASLPVTGHVEQAKDRLVFATTELNRARQAAYPGDLDTAAVHLRAAEGAIDQADLFVTGVERLAAELARAGELAQQGAPHTGPYDDPLDVLRSQGRPLLPSRSAVAAAADFITTHRGAVGAKARTRLSEAERHLAQAVATFSADPDETHETHETDKTGGAHQTDEIDRAAENTGHPQLAQAHALAQEARNLAEQDVRAYGNPYGGPVGDGLAGALLGGIILGETRDGTGRADLRGPACYGGTATRARRTSGGQF